MSTLRLDNSERQRFTIIWNNSCNQALDQMFHTLYIVAPNSLESWSLTEYKPQICRRPPRSPELYDDSKCEHVPVQEATRQRQFGRYRGYS